MAAPGQGRNGTQNTDVHTNKDATADVVSAARRRALKVGLITVPMILTLRSKPVFGQRGCSTLSMQMSATHASHGVMLPPCHLNQPGNNDGNGNGNSNGSNHQ